MDHRSQAFGGRWSRLKAFGGIRGLSCISLGNVDRRLQALGGRWIHLQDFGGIRGSSFTSLWWLLLEFTSLWWQMESCTSLRWLACIAVHKP